MLVKKHTLNNIISTLLILCSIHFYGLYHLFSDSIYDIIDLAFYVIALLIVLNSFFGNIAFKIKPKDWIFRKNILYIFLFLGISSISCFLYHGQFPLLTLLASRFFVFLSLYFLLLALNVRKEFLIQIIYIFAFIYMAVFTLQLILFPFELVPLGRIEGFDRGFLRIRVEGVGFITLGGLMSLNSFLVKRTGKYLLFFFLCLLFVLLLGFRTLLATYLITCFFMIISFDRSIKNRIIKLVLFSIFVIALLQIPIVIDFIEAASLKTTEELASSDKNIRIRTFEFLFYQVNPSIVTILFGNGMAFGGTDYGRLILTYGVEINGFISADIGLLGFAFNFGLFTLISFISVLWLAFRLRINSRYYYLKFFPFYLFISSFTTSESYRAGMFGVICICLLIITIVNSEKNFIQ